MPEPYIPPSRKKDFNSVQLARWKASGLPIDEYLKQSGLHDEGYVFDADKGRFDHPDTYLGEVDPSTIPSAAGRLRARAIQGMRDLVSPDKGSATDRGEGYYSTGLGGVKRASQITESGQPIVGWQDRNTPIVGQKTNRYGSALGTEEDAKFWDRVGAQRGAPVANYWSTKQPPLNPTVRTDPTTGLPHVQIAARYGGGEGSVRYDLPPSAPGFINGVQVEGVPTRNVAVAPKEPIPGSPEWLKKYASG